MKCPPLDPTEDESNVEADYDWLIMEIYDKYWEPITSNMILPEVGKGGSTISWVSSNPDLIAADGTVNQPTFSYAKGAAPVAKAVIKIIWGPDSGIRPIRAAIRITR